jgi:D-alanyl-D-alanine carboxypeptidase
MLVVNRMMFAAVGCIALSSVGVSAETTADILRTWLDDYNTGSADTIKEFEQHYLGDSDIAFATDSREETGGFDLVRIESEGPLKLSALLREHNFPALWRVSFVRESPTADRLQRLDYRALPMSSQSQALAALDSFASRLAAADKFSGVIGIAKGGMTLFAKAWGLADRENKIPVTPDTLFLLASQGKMFTAVGVLQLVEAKKVALEDPIGRYLTNYPNAEVAQKVTVRDLLTHQGGTGEMGLLGPQDVESRGTVHSIGDIIKLNGARGPVFPPGSKFEYSNYGFVLLGALIQKVSGQGYYDYVQQHIFGPAGMTHTGYPLRGHMEGVAIGYTSEEGGGLRPSMDLLPWRGTPAGGGVSTMGDELRFVEALNAGKLLSKSMLAEATRKQAKHYGYGFIVSSDIVPYWGHGGNAPGTDCVLDYYPITGVTFVCLSNRDPIVCDRLGFNYLFRSPRTP